MIQGLFFRGAGPVGAALRWWQRCDRAHAAILFHHPLAGWQVAEALAEKNRVIIREPRDSDGAAMALGFVSPPDFEAERRAVGWLIEQEGKRYDYRGILAFLSRRDLSAREIQLDRERRQVWFCSELFAAFAAKQGRPLLRRAEPWECSVRDAWISAALELQANMVGNILRPGPPSA